MERLIMVLTETRTEKGCFKGCLVSIIIGLILGGVLGHFFLAPQMQAMPEVAGISIFIGAIFGLVLGGIVGLVINFFTMKRDKKEEEF